MARKIIRSLHNLSATEQHAVTTIGNFDGVHRGHQELIEQVKNVAAEKGRPSMVITFEPHPAEFFSRCGVKIARLTRFREKFLALQATGVDYVLVLPFNQALARLTPLEFVQSILVERLQIEHILIGDDFRFGHKREGNFELLAKLGKEFKFGVQSMPTFTFEQQRISSTRIRAALAIDDQALVRALLGRPYSMMGKVRRGDQLGRQWGFPTANIFLHRHLSPVHGIYTVYMHGITERPLPGVANVGNRPTVNGTQTLLEVHLLDFNQNIYGKNIEVEFCSKLRNEENFQNIELLKQQIGQDVLAARQYFQKQGTL